MAMVTPQIFISYAREDARRVEQLYQEMTEAGFKPWMDTKDILPGQRWEPTIEQAIRRADFFLVCLSKNLVNKRGVSQQEIKQALDTWRKKLDRDIFLIPVRLDDCELPRELEEFQAVNLFEADGNTRLARAIRLGMEDRTQEHEPILSEEDRPFHDFWTMLIDRRTLIIIHAEPVERSQKDGHWPRDKDRDGIALLTRTFSDIWPRRNPILDCSAADINTEDYLASSDILLSGSSVSNRITRNFFNHFEGVRYVIDYTMPYYVDIRIHDKINGTRINSTYRRSNELSRRSLVKDIGVLTIMPNPMNPARSLIGCMGIHGFGSLGCFKVLSSPSLLKRLTEFMELPLKDCGYQLLVEYEVASESSHLLEDSIHKIPMNMYR